jgi:DNA adenine methylase
MMGAMQLQLVKAVPPRPFLKWAGGKGQLIPQYEPYFPRQFLTYYEPFLGGGAIFFRLLPKQALLMDINLELVNVYQCIRDRVEETIGLLAEHRDRHCESYYYQIRSHNYDLPVERAARLIYLNKTCFNGLYRENSKGEFNVPVGRYKKPSIYDPELLRVVSQALQSTQIQQYPFQSVLEYASSTSDFVYFDPPYYPISATSKFTSYSRYTFDQSDQIRLRDTFVELAKRGVQVMLSNSDCEFIRELYQGFNIHSILAARSINSKAERRGKITEVLITNY